MSLTRQLVKIIGGKQASESELVDDRPVRDLGLIDLMRPVEVQPRRAAGA